VSGVVCIVCPFTDDEKLKKYSCRSGVISMRFYPPQYPRSSNPLNPTLSLLVSFFCPPPHFSSLFPLFFLFPLIFFLSFAFPFLSSFSDPLLYFFFPCPPPLFLNSFYFCFGVCVRISPCVCACVFGNCMCVSQWLLALCNMW